jgi:glyoxylase-like metal-dependent hydrolase (beta-lactamase superfamily II)
MTGGAPRVGAPSFSLGRAKVTVLNVGDFAMSLSDIFGKGAALAKYFDAKALATPHFYPSNTILIESRGRRVLVDPGDRERLLSAYGVQPPKAPRPPLLLAGQLKAAGVKPDEIDAVVVTHLHYDHFAGLTRREGGKLVPAFPKAAHFLPKKDWEMPDIAGPLAKGDKDLAETLGVVHRAKLVSFFDGEEELGGGVTVVPSPGESPGHQIVRAEGGGRVCYCVGDLYHLKEEVEHPELSASWTEGAVLLESRNAFAERASREGALVLPGHMGPGRIRLKGGAPVWSEE